MATCAVPGVARGATALLTVFLAVPGAWLWTLVLVCAEAPASVARLSALAAATETTTYSLPAAFLPAHLRGLPNAPGPSVTSISTRHSP